MKFKEALINFWKEALIPTRTESSYEWAMEAVGHALLGAFLSLFLSSILAGARILLAIGYWIAKERGDLRRGGGVVDGIVDAGFVMLGTWYGVNWWPIVVLLLAIFGGALHQMLRGDTDVE